MSSQTAAIICAFNEEKTIVNLLQNIFDIPLFEEIIVVNDGSQDSTETCIKQMKRNPKLKDIHLEKNMGKGNAMAIAAELSSSRYLIFIDADLSNFNSYHAHQLLDPLITRKADMVLGQATNTLIPHQINPFKSLSGQRAVLKNDILPLLEKMKPSGFGVETLINLHYRKNHKAVKYVSLHHLKHPTKFAKTKFPKALKEFTLEAFQIIKTLFTNIVFTPKPSIVYTSINKSS